jgi:tripartite-type tricarboxylate transporter receptor subunit TctC
VFAAALPAVASAPTAEAYPTRPVRWLVGFPPGGASDIFARLMAQWLSESYGRQFVVENRPGAASNIATEIAVRARPDGHTLVHLTTVNTVNATLYENLSFDIVRDIAPVAGIMRGLAVVVVNPAVPVRTIPELIAYAKANPGKLAMGSGGNGSPQHIFGELFKTMTGVDMLHVPYRGGAPALRDLLGGQVQVMFDTISTSIEHIKAGVLRPLAVTTATRSALLPDVPTVGEFVPNYEASGWQGVGAPKNTPAEIIDALNKRINAGLAHPRIKTRIADLGSVPLPTTPSEFGRLIAAEKDKWAKVVRLSRAKPN